jgi:hypothetical protein
MSYEPVFDSKKPLANLGSSQVPVLRPMSERSLAELRDGNIIVNKLLPHIDGVTHIKNIALET